MTKIRKYRICFIILLILLIPLVSPFLNSTLKINEDFLFNDKQDKNNIPKSSGFWIRGPLHIKDTGGGGDYTWAEAVLQDWCSGAGSLNNPYRLENITIDAGGNNYGILIENSNNKFFTIKNCTVMNSGSAINSAGIKLLSSSNGTIEDNKCFDHMKTGILIQTSSTFNAIRNNYIYNGSSGIAFDTGCDFNSIINNTVINCTYGIEIWGSSNVNITKNRVTKNFGTFGHGIVIYGQNVGINFFISNNTVSTHHDSNGIFLNFCNESTVINNRVFNNQHGIYNRGKHNYIASNLLANNYNGLTVQQGYNSTHFNNTIIDNERGIYVERGTNTFYMNYLIDNNLENVLEETTEQNNWSYNSTGNYWSDYTGVDLNDDGIGDSPYLINGLANSQDDYPIWDDGENVLPTISINSPSEGSLFGTDAPTFSLNIFDLNLNKSWCTLNYLAAKYFFSPSNGINIVPIDETGWDSLSDGLITIIFYVNDSNGNIANVSRVIAKDATNPTITLNSPLEGATFGSDAPEFSLTIYDSHLRNAWYTIGSSDTQHSFSPSNGTNIVPIDEISWDTLPEGDLTIIFFVDDTLGNNHTIQVVINKSIPVDIPEPVIPFGHYYLVFLGIGVLALLLVQSKKRKR